jgi:hypothetical protein
LNRLLPEASLKDVISETRLATAERGVNRDGEEGNGEEGNGEEGNGEEGIGKGGNAEEGIGEEGNGSSFVSARKDACASGRNAIPSRIQADRARAVGRSHHHRLISGRLPASRGRGCGSHPW